MLEEKTLRDTLIGYKMFTLNKIKLNKYSEKCLQSTIFMVNCVNKINGGFYMYLYKYFPVYQAEEYKKGVKLIPSRDTVKMLFRGSNADEVTKTLKLNLMNYLNRYHNTDITKVRLVDYPLDVIEGLTISTKHKEKLICIVIPASDLTPKKLKLVDEIKHSVDNNTLASVIYSCLYDYYLGLDVVPQLTKNGYSAHFLNCLRDKSRAKVARGSLPTSQMLVNHLLLFPQEYDELIGAYKAHLASVIASKYSEGKYPTLIEKSRTGLSKRLIERYGRLDAYLTHRGITASNYIGVLNRRTLIYDEAVIKLAQDAEVDVFDLIYSNLVDMVDYLIKQNYKKMGLAPRPSKPKRQTTEEQTHIEPDEPQGVFSLDDFNID